MEWCYIVKQAIKKERNSAPRAGTAKGPRAGARPQEQADGQAQEGPADKVEPEDKQRKQAPKLPEAEHQPPIVTINISGKTAKALIDCGATRSLVNTKLVKATDGRPRHTGSLPLRGSYRGARHSNGSSIRR